MDFYQLMTLLRWRPIPISLRAIIITLTLLTELSFSVGGDARDNTEEPPTITLAPKNQHALNDEVVTFLCQVSGYPTPNIYWKQDSRQLSPNTNRDFLIIDTPDGSVLRIDPVQVLRDNYTHIECTADNGIGEANASALLVVYTQGAEPFGYPVIMESPTLKAVEVMRDTIMKCSAGGDPHPNILWLKDFIPVDLQDPRLTLLWDGSLQIQSSKESDEGKYECVAENSIGVVYSYGANLYVRVRRRPPRFTIRPEKLVKVTAGEDVNLTCAAQGSPMPYVQWQLGSVIFTEEAKIPIGQNILQLTDVRVSANYTCIASSDLGILEAIVEVQVEDSKNTKQVFSKNNRLHSGASDFLPEVKSNMFTLLVTLVFIFKDV